MFIIDQETNNIVYKDYLNTYYKGIEISDNLIIRISNISDILFDNIIYKIIGYFTAIIKLENKYILIKIIHNNLRYLYLNENINIDDIKSCFIINNKIKYIFTSTGIYNTCFECIYEYNDFIKADDDFVLHGNKCILVAINTTINNNKIFDDLIELSNIEDFIFYYIIENTGNIIHCNYTFKYVDKYIQPIEELYEKFSPTIYYNILYPKKIKSAMSTIKEI